MNDFGTTPTPEHTPVFADYVDGVNAVVQRVSLWSKPGAYVLTLPDGEQLTWPLDDLRALPDQADAAGIVIKPSHVSLERLIITDPGIAKVIREAAPNLAQRPPVTNMPGIFKWAGGAVASVALIVFVLVPIMANQLANFLPPAGERALGDATFEQIRAALSSDSSPVRLCERPAGLGALEAMERRLNASEDLPYPLEVAVLDHDMVNAFALPGGRVILFRGLIDKSETAEEVAAVLAHEIGHVVNRDPTRDALRSAGSIGVLGLLFGDFAGGTVVLFLANQLVNAKYSQSAEAGADEYAHDLLRDADIDPAALGAFFERMYEDYGDAEGFMAHLASHPQTISRIEAAQAASAGSNYANDILTAAQWRDLRGICGAQPDDDAEEQESPQAGRDGDKKSGGGLSGSN